MFQAIGRVSENDVLKNTKVDVLLLTIANRVSSEQLIQKRLLPSKARTVIPLHYDNFFLTMRRHNTIDEVWGVKVDEFKEKLNSQAKHVKAEWPRYCEEVSVL